MCVHGVCVAESMAFCGDIGCYFLGQSDIEDGFKELVLELLNVAGGFIKKFSTPMELKRYSVFIAPKVAVCYMVDCYIQLCD